MRKLVPILLLAAIVALVAWFFFKPAHTYRNYPPTATGAWVAFGDSLTEGYGASRGEDYPTLLGKAIGVGIRNQGVSGQTTQGALGRLDSIASEKPRVVLLCLGGNDFLQQLPKDTTFGNLGQMIDRFHQEGSFVVLIGVRSTSFRDKNAEHFAALAKQKDVLYIEDIFKGIMFRPTLMSDAIHPNAEGYKLIAQRLQEELMPYLPALKN